MLRVNEHPFRSLFVLRRVPNQRRCVLTERYAHLYAQQQLTLSTYRLLRLCRKKETGARTRMWTPMIMCAAVSTPGLRNGNWTRKAKTQGGGWRRGRTTQDCSKSITVGSAHVWQSDDTEGRPSSTSSRDRLSPDWLDAVTSAGTTCSFHQQTPWEEDERLWVQLKLTFWANYPFDPLDSYLFRPVQSPTAEHLIFGRNYEDICQTPLANLYVFMCLLNEMKANL